MTRYSYRTNFLITAVFGIFLLVLSGCFSPWTGEDTTLTIGFGGNNSRSALPWASADPAVLNDLLYNVQLSGPDGAKHVTAKGGSVIKISVTPGIWNIEVKAYYRAESFLYAAGSGSAEAKAGQSNSATVSMVKKYYEVGDTGPGGGTIFYVADGREGRPFGFTVEGYTGAVGSFASYTAHYLEVAPNDSGSGLWASSTGTPLPNAHIEGISAIDINVNTNYNVFTHPINQIGNGRKDTMLIVAYLGTVVSPIQAGRAAQLAAAETAGGKNNWFLPSSGELNLIYTSTYLAGMSGIYWSSTQRNNLTGNQGLAFYQDFTAGGTYNGRDNGTKGISYNVRAIRAF